LLRSGEQPAEPQRWHDRLEPLVTEARKRLAGVDPSELAARSGCARDPDGFLRLTCLWQQYLIDLPDLTVRQSDTGREPSTFTQALLLTYLDAADGTAPSGRWIAYRDLPGGMFYAQAFHGYAEIHLVRELGDEGLEAFCRAAERLGGERIEIGNAGYAFRILPRVHLAAVYWLGDEDFPSQASILFEDSATHYVTTDGLAVLGSRVAEALIEAARTRKD
jgi:hypothetical protein